MFEYYVKNTHILELIHSRSKSVCKQAWVAVVGSASERLMV